MNPYTLIPYDTRKFDFVDLVKDYILPSGPPLHRAHERLNRDDEKRFEVGADSKTEFHHEFYKCYHRGWLSMVTLYRTFIREVIAPRMIKPFLYQKFPTFRVHLPGNVAVGAYHTDAEFHHPHGEINFIIPLTDADGTASMFLESSPGKGDYTPVPMRVGNLIMFHGNQLSHGNEINGTERTRMSMDFRVLPAIYYHGEASESLTMKTKFVEGEYYDRFE